MYRAHKIHLKIKLEENKKTEPYACRVDQGGFFKPVSKILGPFL